MASSNYSSTLKKEKKNPSQCTHKSTWSHNTQHHKQIQSSLRRHEKLYLIFRICVLNLTLSEKLLNPCSRLLDPFAKLRRASISFVMSVCPCVRVSVCPCVRVSVLLSAMEHSAPTGRIWYFSIYRKSVQKTQVSFKSDKNNGCFTWRPVHIFDHVALSFS